MKELLYSFANITAKEYQQLNNPSPLLVNKIKKSKTLDIHKIETYLKSCQVSYITLYDETYPSLLKEIYDPPYIIYYRGDLNILKYAMFAIVGSRKATSYTKFALKQIIPHLKEYAIISGLAYGADDMAHQIAIENNIPTVGVLAFGHSIHYPKVTQNTRNIIEEKFITISEFPPNSELARWKFVSRNRIIAGCALGTLVTEAEIGSGSLITLEMAIEENRHVFCLPGNMTSSLSLGTNLRIQEGCTPVVFPEDIEVTLNNNGVFKN